MAEIIRKNLGKFLVTLTLVSVFIAGFFIFSYFSARAQEEIKILPESFTGDWQNPEAVFSQDLGSAAAWEEFSQKNSAYPLELAKEVTGTGLWMRFKNLFKPEAQAESSVCKNGANQSCSTEVGACRIGVQICQDGVWGKCIGGVFPAQEICDGVDNNCDGQIDEGACAPETCQNSANRPCSSDIGACRIGIQICQDGVWGKCIGAKTPSLEICDQVDNDCDGQTDEGGVCGGKSTENSSPLIEKTLVLAGFGITPIENSKIKLAQLKLSLAGKGSAGDKFIIDYFYQDVWHNLAVFNLENEISNALNGGFFVYGLPIFENWSDLNDLRIRFTYQQGAENSSPRVFLDAAWLEVQTEELGKQIPAEPPLQVIGEGKVILKSIKKDWRRDEEPEFEISDAPQGFWEKIKSLFQKEEKSVVLLSPRSGKELSDRVTIQGNKIKITKPPEDNFRPGLYKLRIKIKQGGEEFIQTQDFAWGVLTINTSKSIYLPSETAYLQMAVLRDSGHTICNANLKLEIINPEGGSASVNVERSGKCFANNVTDVPDYFAYYQVEGPGVYQMKLTNLDNGYEITDSFEVRESVPFDIERIGPTRIYPLANYEMKLKIKANQDFKGEVKEFVPSDFKILGEIRWQADWQAGETHELSYTFDAPNIWPYIFLLGPLQIGGSPSTGSGSPRFSEARRWQIASDAVEVITNTALTEWAVPEDWNDSDNSVETIGGGGGAGDGSQEGTGGGGGGAYARTNNINLTPEGSAQIQVGDLGAGAIASNGSGGDGGDTWFDGTSCTPPASASVCADSGKGSPGNSSTAGAGGDAVQSIGTILTRNGGTGGVGAAEDHGGGGGGAAGPNGVGGTGGAAGSGAAGGGGGGGGGTASNGGNGDATVGGVGGNDYAGLGGGRPVNGQVGGNATTSGGGGAGGDNGLAGGNGISNTGGEWGSGYGSGGGGGGAGANAGVGGNGGGYGGGGGGGETFGGNGSQGIIVVTYTPFDLDINASTTGTQNTPIEVSTANNYLGGAFTLVRNQGAASTTNIKITEYGTIDATNLTNVELFYEYDTSAPYNCVGLTYNAGVDLQFGLTSSTFSGADGFAEFSSSTAYVTDTQALCLYMEVDVGAGASADQTIDIKINAASDITVFDEADPSVTLTTGEIIGQSVISAPSNAAPTITNVVFYDGNAFTPNEWTQAAGGTKIATTTFTVTDTNTCADISTTTLYLYHSDVANCSTTAQASPTNCYPSTSTASAWTPRYGNGDLCSQTSCSGDTATFLCTSTLYFSASSTAVWMAFASTSDLSYAQANRTSNVGSAQATVNALQALEVSNDIGYATLLPGQDSGQSWVTTTATSTGNTTIDIKFHGGSLTKSGDDSKHIPAFLQQFTTTSNLTYGAASGVVSLATSTGVFTGDVHDVTMVKATGTVPYPSSADNILWGIGIPSGQAIGTYSSTTNFVVTTAIVVP